VEYVAVRNDPEVDDRQLDLEPDQLAVDLSGVTHQLVADEPKETESVVDDLHNDDDLTKLLPSRTD